MICPATTPAGPLFVMARSACGTTVVGTLAVLLALFVSIAEETVALFIIPPPVTGAVIAIVSVASELPVVMIVVFVHVIVPPAGAPHVQPVPEPLAAVTPAGSVSTTVIVPTVGSGPLLMTLIGELSGAPAIAV